METFTILNKVTTITKENKKVTIVKVIKNGTKRTFFAPMADDKFLNKTRFARLYDAERLAKLFLNTL